MSIIIGISAGQKIRLPKFNQHPEQAKLSPEQRDLREAAKRVGQDLGAAISPNFTGR